MAGWMAQKCQICGDVIPEGKGHCPRHRASGPVPPRGTPTPDRTQRPIDPITEATIPSAKWQSGKVSAPQSPPKGNAAGVRHGPISGARAANPSDASDAPTLLAQAPLHFLEPEATPPARPMARRPSQALPKMPPAAPPAPAPAAAPAAPAAPAGHGADPLLGQTLGEFKLTELIGVGGMGMVYKGVHPLIGKTVAIKVLRPEAADDPEQVLRMLDEARALTAVHHPGIVDVFSFGTLPDGRPYLVMEYLKGRSLQAQLEAQGRVQVDEALQIFDGVLGGLGAAHKVGLVHRDMKPSNILLVHEGDTVLAKIVDFGIAKQGQPGALTPQTLMFRCIGTPEFVSPEQACGQPVGPQSDLYSFGVVAFFALTGKLPFEGENDAVTLMKQVEHAPPDPKSFEPSIPEPVAKLVLRLLEKKPSHRPATAEEVRTELIEIRKQRDVAKAAEAGAATARPSSVSPEVAAAMKPKVPKATKGFRPFTLLLFLIAAGSGVAWWYLRVR